VLEFVFMLTHNDRTVPDALDVLDRVATTGLRHIGFKDVGASPEMQRELTDAAHAAGLTVHLEVVSVTADDELRSIESAMAAGVDAVVGGTNVEAALGLLRGSQVMYSPFPGTIVGHPSALTGSVEDIAHSAAELTALDGVHGVDLLAYRHRTAPVAELLRAVVAASSGPVLVAGSITTEAQINAIAEAGAWGFTIGGAVFEGGIGPDRDVVAQVEAALAMAERVSAASAGR